jgi:uncharacterized membrane protein YedE/YeeE
LTDVTSLALSHTVLWCAFALACVFGAVQHRAQFCAMGAVADIVSFGDWTRMRMWTLAIATALLGTNALAAAGLVDLDQSIYTGSDVLWLSALLGGLVFGFGMVLASGCGSRTLVRLGAGSLKAVVVFAMLAIGAWATMRGILAAPRAYGLDKVTLALAGPQDLPSLLARHSAWPLQDWRLLLGCGGGLLLGAWSLAPALARTPRQLLGGIGVGACVVGLWWVSGHLGFVAEDPQTLLPTFVASTNNHMESFTFVAPLANTLNWLLMYTDAANVLNIGIVSAFGVVAGSALHALASRRFRWEGLVGVADTANHIAGGLLMGIGGVTAMGCTIGQGITGISTLSISSWIAFLSIVAGAALGVKFQAWRLDRAG